MTKPLTPRQRMFVKEYLKDLNASKAYVRCGYKTKNAANNLASRMLADVRISSLIAKEFESRAAKVELSVEQIIKELHGIATSNVADAMQEDGRLKNVHDMPEALQKAISSIEVDEIWESIEDTNGRKIKEQNGWVKKVRFWEKTKALELLGKYLAMWIEKHEVSGPGGLPLPAVTVNVISTKAPEVSREQTLAGANAA